MKLLEIFASCDLVGAALSESARIKNKGKVLLYPYKLWPGKKRTTKALRRAGVELYNCYLYPTDGTVRVVCSDPERAVEVLDKC